MNADIVAFQEMESFAGGNDGSVNLTPDWLLERDKAYSAAIACYRQNWLPAEPKH